jgi:hypothetical protein
MTTDIYPIVCAACLRDNLITQYVALRPEDKPNQTIGLAIGQFLQGLTVGGVKILPLLQSDMVKLTMTKICIINSLMTQSSWAEGGALMIDGQNKRPENQC